MPVKECFNQMQFWFLSDKCVGSRVAVWSIIQLRGLTQLLRSVPSTEDGIWEPEIINLTDIIQTQVDKYHMLALTDEL